MLCLGALGCRRAGRAGWAGTGTGLGHARRVIPYDLGTKRGGSRAGFVRVKRRVSTGGSVEELGDPGGSGPADGAAGSGGQGAGVDGERVGERCHGVLVGVDDLDV